MIPGSPSSSNIAGKLGVAPLLSLCSCCCCRTSQPCMTCINFLKGMTATRIPSRVLVPGSARFLCPILIHLLPTFLCFAVSRSCTNTSLVPMAAKVLSLVLRLTHVPPCVCSLYVLCLVLCSSVFYADFFLCDRRMSRERVREVAFCVREIERGAGVTHEARRRRRIDRRARRCLTS